MAKYMIAYDLSKENRNEAIKRFVDGKAMQPPEGVTDLGRWHAAGGRLGWAVAETDDPKHLADWVMSWSDIIDYEIHPVISDEELGALFAKHELG